MSLEHHQHHHYAINKVSRLRFAILLTCAGMLIEFAGGLFSGSLALISDAWHMLTHLLALGMSYIAVTLALKPLTKRHTYGFYRAEVLAAFINGILLIFISGYIVYDAVLRTINPQQIKITEMLFVAFVGLIINGVTIILLAKASHGDMNIRSALLHEAGDMASSIAIVGGGFFILYTKNYIVDPILAFFISILILVWAIKLIIEASHILLESTPRHLDIDELITAVKSEIPDVYEIHHVHAWTIASSMYALTAHVVINDCQLSATNEILKKINYLVKERFHIAHTNIQFECVLKK